MNQLSTYPIGTSGKPWGAAEVAQWRAQQQPSRHYQEDVVSVIESLQTDWDVTTYGEIQYGDDYFTLYALQSKDWDPDLPCALITGGVHGYETSGVLGALRFLTHDANAYTGRMNLLVIPCVSPWAYERIQRWNYDAVDPNRSFIESSPAQEAAALIHFLKPLKTQFIVHIDLHETTDTDESEFAPAKAARDGVVFEPCPIPDGFYLVANAAKPVPDFQAAIIAAVQHVTYIAVADENGCLDGTPMAARGVLNSSVQGVCADVTNAAYTTTTEVYPDSPMTTPEQCIKAQTVAVCAGLDFVLSR
ncbi:M14 family metallopeptidase [Ostreibacterium oceani]|uniref:DUF2817 domain-containing protein n=1 Tax=Ostreibacterium oceani TaxID=2654998 RepID=A0A6N7EVZ2_9GAMM|nr:M14 family metallocarboxypeptidase [Ostreibacterium oceani]MPV86721.1 DUF2817 domain-containing protein [Ostreibacterium oceani]